MERAYVVRATGPAERITVLAYITTCAVLGAVTGPGK